MAGAVKKAEELKAETPGSFIAGQIEKEAKKIMHDTDKARANYYN